MATDLSLRNPDFLAAVASVTSTLQGQPLDELIGEDVRQHRRTRRRGGRDRRLATLAVAASVFGVIASQQRDEARRQEQIAVAQKKIATEQRDQARRRLVQLNVANGSRAAPTPATSPPPCCGVTEAAKLEADHAVEQACCAPAWRRSLVGIPAWRKCGLPLRPSAASDSLTVPGWSSTRARGASKPGMRRPHQPRPNRRVAPWSMSRSPRGKTLLTVDTDGAHVYAHG